MNIFRIPLNFLVVVALIKVSSFSTSTVFGVIVSWLVLGALLQSIIVRKTEAISSVSKGIVSQ